MIIWPDILHNRARLWNALKQVYYDRTYKLRRRFWKQTHSITRTFSISGKSTDYTRGAYRKECNPTIDREMARMRRVEY